MKTFKSFISESGNSHYPFKTGNSDLIGGHTYYFQDNTGKHKGVYVKNHDDREHATVVFYEHDPDGFNSTFDATGENGHSAVKVFSTVKHILKHHSIRYPSIHTYSFSSEKSEPTRERLYNMFVKKMNGSTKEGATVNHHFIPAKTLTESISFIGYHGSPHEFDSFNTNDVFLAKSKDEAKRYGPHVYEVSYEGKPKFETSTIKVIHPSQVTSLKHIEHNKDQVIYRT